MTKPQFWKLSMGKEDFRDILEVVDWLRQGLVLAHSKTKKKANVTESQGEQFTDANRDGEYFYLCHGNRTTLHARRGIILLGRFTGPGVTVRHHRWKDNGWVGRKVEWMKTAVTPKKLAKQYAAQWTPRNNSTFVNVPEKDWDLFEQLILGPYFDTSISRLVRR